MPNRTCSICGKKYLRGFTQILQATDGRGSIIDDTEVHLCSKCAPVHAEFFKQFVTQMQSRKK